MAYYVYVLECSDQFLYTGVTSELESRIEKHHIGYYENCYTYNRRPLNHVFTKEFQWIQDAIAFETQFKKWSRKKKWAYIKGDFDLLRELSKSKSRQ